MYKWISFLVLVYAFAKAETTHAQKTELEYRINEAQVPEIAKAFIQGFEQTKRLKWIQEESEEGTAIEAKFLSQGERYSVEFSPDGVLQDIEILAGFDKISQNSRKAITAYLKGFATYYKVQKTQRQYVPEQLQDITTSLADTLKVLPPQAYELVVKTRNSGEKAQTFEFLFDSEGQLISQQRIAQRSDNILRF